MAPIPGTAIDFAGEICEIFGGSAIAEIRFGPEQHKRVSFTMGKFVMPEVGTAAYDKLAASMSAKPVSYPQLNLIRQLFKQLGDFSHVAITDEEKRILAFRSVRNNEGHWVNLDVKKYNSWQACQLINLLNKAINAGVKASSKKPEPVAAPVASNDAPVIEHGQLIMVHMHGELVTKRVNVVGNRVTLGRP